MGKKTHAGHYRYLAPGGVKGPWTQPKGNSVVRTRFRRYLGRHPWHRRHDRRTEPERRVLDINASGGRGRNNQILGKDLCESSPCCSRNTESSQIPDDGGACKDRANDTYRGRYHSQSYTNGIRNLPFDDPPAGWIWSGFERAR